MDYQKQAAERIILAVDSSDVDKAQELVSLARAVGATSVKLGLELQTASSWRVCSELAKEYDLDWTADAKLNDIPNTVDKAVANICSLDHPPTAITIHTNSGMETMRRAQAQAGLVKMLGVTVLTSTDDSESRYIYRRGSARQVKKLANLAAQAGLAGLVCSPQEVRKLKARRSTADMFTMIPGIRPAGADTQDQARVATPTMAINDGADLLVIGRPITQADNPKQAFESIASEIAQALANQDLF